MDESTANYSEHSNEQSHATSLSDLTGYEEELSNIKQYFSDGLNHNDLIYHLKFTLENFLDGINYSEPTLTLLKKEVDETLDEVLLRIASVGDLKAKICQQHMELQSEVQANKKFKNSLLALKGELELCKKSEEWFKQQLHKCQADKASSLKENFYLKRSLVDLEHRLENSRTDVQKWKVEYENVQRKGKIEQEKLLKTIKELGVSKHSCTHYQSDEKNNNLSQQYYESVIQELGNEIQKTKLIIEEQEFVFQKYNKDNADLLSRLTVMQKSLDEKEFLVEQLEIQKTELNHRLMLTLDTVADLQKQNVTLSAEKEEAEVKLISCNQEKFAVQETLNKIRDDFNKVIGTHKSLKRELNEKEKLIRDSQCYKQKEFMDSNWKICTNAELKQNSSQIEMLHNTISMLRKRESDLLEHNMQISNDISNSQLKISKLESTIDVLQGSLKNATQKQTKLATNLESQNLIDEKNLEVQLLQTTNSELKSEILKRENNVIALLEQHSALQCDLNACKLELNELKKRNVNLKVQNKLLLENVPESDIKTTFDFVCDAFLDLQQRLCSKEKIAVANLSISFDDKSSQFVLKKLEDIVNEILKDLQTKFERIEDEIASKQCKRKNKEQIISQEIANLINRCEKITQKSTSSQEILKSLLGNDNHLTKTVQENKELKAQIVVQEKHMQQKQKRYEECYRTLLHKVKELKRAKNSFQNKIKNLQEMYDSLLEGYPNFNTFHSNGSKITKPGSNALETEVNDVQQLKHLSKQLEEKNLFLVSEIEILNSTLHQKNTELNQLHLKNLQLKVNLDKNERSVHNVMGSLHTDMQILENDLNSVKNEKYFLQRLCNDLKLALQSSAKHCEILKERICVLNLEKEDFRSLPDVLPDLPSPSRYDEEHIKKLLQQSMSLPAMKSVGEVQECLNSLKKELFALQQQVNEKTLCCL